MNIEIDYDKEMEKLEKEKLEFEKHKKEQLERINQEKKLLNNFESSLDKEDNIYGFNYEKKIKDTTIKDLEAEKLEYENKIKDIETQINFIEEEKELFNNFRNDCENQLNIQLIEINKKKSEIEEMKKIVDEQYNNVLKRELKYVSDSEKFEKKKKIINELLDEVKNKEIENKNRAKNISDYAHNFDNQNNEIEINKKQFDEKLRQVRLEQEKVNKEKKIVEAKKKDLLLRLESINLVGMKLYGNKMNQGEEQN